MIVRAFHKHRVPDAHDATRIIEGIGDGLGVVACYGVNAIFDDIDVTTVASNDRLAVLRVDPIS